MSERTDDPIITDFLSFLDREIEHSAESVKPLWATRIEEARSLTKIVEVSDDESLPDWVTVTEKDPPEKNSPTSTTLHSTPSPQAQIVSQTRQAMIKRAAKERK